MITKQFSPCQTAESGRIASVITAASAFRADASLGLCCDGVPLSEIAARVGTPTYVYSAASIRSAWTRLDAAFGAVPHALHYALKANSTLAILRAAPRRWAAARTRTPAARSRSRCAPASFPRTWSSPASARRPRNCGGPSRSGLKAINAESPGEVDRVDALARAAGVRARVAVRLNPDIDAGGHPHISTGRRINKFGVPIELGRDLYRRMSRMTGLQPVGVHVHIGSQITDLAPLARGGRGAGRVRGRPGRGRHRARAHRPRRRPRHLVRRLAGARVRRLRGGGAARPPAHGAHDAARAGPGHRRAVRRCCSAA